MSQAAFISDLFNTGVDNAGTPLPDLVDDPHYTITTHPGLGGLADVTTPADGFPIPPWFANDANSRWIGPGTDDAVGPLGQYIYRTTFTLPANADLASVSINGLWGTDNPGTDIFINGASTGMVSAGFTTLTAFAITSGFVTGTNTLDFDLTHLGGPTGLRVDDMVGEFSFVGTAVPEPSTFAVWSLLCLSLTGAVAWRRRNW